MPSATDTATAPLDVSPLKVLMILETYLPDIGGAEFHIHYLAQHMQAMGHSVEIVTGATDVGPEHRDICPVHRFPHAVGRRAFPYALIWLFRFIALFRRFDVIHAHHPSFLAFIAVIAGRITGKRVIVSLHGLGAHDSSVGTCPIRTLYRRVALGMADRIIATSEELRAIGLRFSQPERVAFITNGVDTAVFAPRGPRSFASARDNLRLISLRRLTPKNGVHFAIQALGAAGKRLAFTLRITGDGPLRGRFERAVEELGLGDRVHFQGFVSHEEMVPELDQADVALFLSTAESTSLAALECMAMGCLVVCSNAGAFPRFVENGVTGHVVHLFDNGTSRYDAPDALEPEQVERVVQTLVAIQQADPAELDAMAARARKTVQERFDWSVIARRTVAEVYRPMLAG
jgi:glycosyltransferase involved in cell wall biosynthesis